jgi:hypothetical protein
MLLPKAGLWRLIPANPKIPSLPRPNPQGPLQPGNISFFPNFAKKTMRIIPLLFLLLLQQTLGAQNQLPVLSNVQVSINGTLLTLSYDLADAENDPVVISFRAGAAGSASLSFDTGDAAGDLGPGILPGSGKQVQWDFGAWASSLPAIRLMLVADDLQPVDIQALVDQADSTRLLSDLQQLEGVRHRTAGAAHLADTKNMILSNFEEQGLEVWEQAFPYGTYTGTNLLGQKAGIAAENSAVLVGAHFDSVSGSPGADDNASGVAGTLEVLRLLSAYSFEKTVRFVGFDLEEVGLKGSQRYVQEGLHPDEAVAGYLNLEMIGYYSEAPFSQQLPAGFNLLYPDLYAELAAEQFKGDFAINIGEALKSIPLMNAFENAATTYVPELKVKSLAAPAAWQTLTPDLGRSDHAPFWVAGWPALMISDGADMRNPLYHTPADTAGTLNYTFMMNIAKAAAATIATLAGIRHADTWCEVVELPTASMEKAPACQVQLSPNPASNSLRLDWSECPGAAGPLFFSLADMQGRQVLRKQLPASERSLQVGLERLAPGTYLARLGNWQQQLLIAR